jgi:hypothetical protein
LSHGGEFEWCDDGHWLIVTKKGSRAGRSGKEAKLWIGGELTLTVIDLASGHREMWKRIPDDYSSRVNQLLVATPDLKYYGYPFPRYSSVLYTVENLH